MADSSIHAVTGAFGFTGKAIAQHLIEQEKRVRTLTTHPRNPAELGGNVDVAPLNFDNYDELKRSLDGVSILYNTYWVRIAYGGMTFEKAIDNSQKLIKAAEEAGVSRIVHISITNPSERSKLPYFSGKAKVEKAITESKLSYTILRPAVFFGKQGALINNIAWFMRHLPAFAIPGDGNYHIQPTYVEDLAELAVAGGESSDNKIIDAVGPETFTFNDLVYLIREKTNAKAIITHVNPALAYLGTSMLGATLGDVVLTKEEVDGLTQNLLVSNGPPTCRTRFSEWLTENSTWLGTEYMNDLKKHYK